MTDKPIDLIDKYLERVKVYLPLGSEDTLAEIRTHLIEEAEALGQGQLTHGSAMLAIERFGDSKDAASAYAGTGRKIGPVPAEYTMPLLRLVLLLIVLATLFVVGASMIGIALPDVLGSINFPFIIITSVVMSLIYAVLIIGGLSYLDRGGAASEKTVVERILGIGSGAFKPKPLSDAVADLIFAIIFLLVLTSPLIRSVVYPEWLPFVYPAIILALCDGIKALLFMFVGENNVNLIIEALVGASWVVLCMFLINIPFPLQGIPVFITDHWTIVTLAELMELFPGVDIVMPFNLFWIGVIFVIVLTSLWEVMVASIKIPMYLSAGKGWWWKGEHGQARWRKYRPAKRAESRPGHEDGHTPSNY
ncbi:MAG: hypothetical protein HXY34_09395 [Candidatus Thorarchaeota archaeon]|nr:hypothetical protein [Candidatus Thorarchaeota archaeon]